MRYLLAFFIATSVASCGLGNSDCKDTVRCLSNDVVWPTLVGFTKEEIDTVIINRYRAGGGFSEKLSTEWCDSTLLMAPKMGQAGTPWPCDTIAGEVYFYPDIRLIVSGYGDDVEMVVPAAGRTYRITEIKYDGAETKEIEHPCYQQVNCSRQLISYKVDGATVSKAGRQLFRK